jgi:AcrR family transcriptional regulator
VSKSARPRRGAVRLGQPRGAIPKEDRLDEVIAVATRLFRENGFRATRLDDIADALGVTRAALYYYFDGKRDVLEEVCSRAMASTEAALRRIQDLDDPAERLHGFAHQYAQNMAGDAARVFARDNQELRPAFRRGLMARARAVTDGAEEILRYGIEHGAFDPELDVHITARGFLGMLNSLADWHRANRDGPLSDTAHLLVDVFITGLAVRTGKNKAGRSSRKRTALTGAGSDGRAQ